MSDEENSSSGGTCIPFILFILNCIIVANTNKEDFGLVIDGGEDFYIFHLTCMIASICMIVCLLILTWVAGWTSANRQVDLCGRVWVLCTGLYIIALVAFQYWKIGVIWDRHPHHTIMFYRDFWSDGLTHFDNVSSSVLITSGKVYATSDIRRLAQFTGHHWPYIMSDVVTRIYGFCMMSVPVLLSTVVCCLCLCGGYPVRIW